MLRPKNLKVDLVIYVEGYGRVGEDMKNCQKCI